MPSDIVKRMADSSGLSEDEIAEKLKEKQEELSGLISEEGAAYILAKELGLQLARKTSTPLESVVPGMQNVEIVGRVVTVFPAREFKTEKASGKVQNMIIGDSTGTVRLSLWNDEIEKYKIQQGDAMRVRGFVKEDNMGRPEVRLGKFGTMKKTDEPVPVMTDRSAERAKISELREGSYNEIRGALLQIFESNPFYEICSVCGARLKESKCTEHESEIDYGMVVSGIVDDGSDSIRIVLFNENAEKMLGMTKKDARKILQAENASAIYKNVSLGEEYIIEGRARRNAFFDRLELIANNVKNADSKEEITSMMI